MDLDREQTRVPRLIKYSNEMAEIAEPYISAYEGRKDEVIAYYTDILKSLGVNYTDILDNFPAGSLNAEFKVVFDNALKQENAARMRVSQPPPPPLDSPRSSSLRLRRTKLVPVLQMETVESYPEALDNLRKAELFQSAIERTIDNNYWGEDKVPDQLSGLIEPQPDDEEVDSVSLTYQIYEVLVKYVHDVAADEGISYAQEFNRHYAMMRETMKTTRPPTTRPPPSRQTISPRGSPRKP